MVITFQTVLLMLIGLNGVATEGNNPWITWNGSLYLFSDQQDVTFRLGYAEAETHCASHNATLASVLGEDETQFILDNILSREQHWVGLQFNDSTFTNCETCVDFNSGCYLNAPNGIINVSAALRCLQCIACKNDSRWQWSDGTPVNWRNWQPEQPNLDGKCVRLHQELGTWYDGMCDNKLHFICKKEITSDIEEFTTSGYTDDSDIYTTADRVIFTQCTSEGELSELRTSKIVLIVILSVSLLFNLMLIALLVLVKAKMRNSSTKENLTELSSPEFIDNDTISYEQQQSIKSHYSKPIPSPDEQLHTYEDLKYDRNSVNHSSPQEVQDTNGQPDFRESNYYNLQPHNKPTEFHKQLSSSSDYLHPI